MNLQPEPMISFEDVAKVYPNGASALRGITLSVPKQDFIFLVGPSGAGKSTLIKLLTREEKATTGQVKLDGEDLALVKNSKLPYVRRKMGTIFQDFKLLPKLKVYENVEFALRVTEGIKADTRDKIYRLLETVGLEGQEEKFPSEMSGGQQQRVAIARALSHEPKVLLADEPTGNLDPSTSWEILQLLLRINSMGTTVLMATHNKEIVDVIRKRVIVINNGIVTRDDASGGYHEADADSLDDMVSHGVSLPE